MEMLIWAGYLIVGAAVAALVFLLPAADESESSSSALGSTRRERRLVGLTLIAMAAFVALALSLGAG